MINVLLIVVSSFSLNNNISFEKYGIHETAAIGLRVILHIVINGYGETVTSRQNSSGVIRMIS